MARNFSVHGKITEPTNVVEISLSRNIQRSERLSQIMVNSMHELLGEDARNVWISRPEGRLIAEVPTRLVSQNDYCRILRGRFYDLFNRNRSLQQKVSK